ncbi:hypothetical protein B0T22DRAFT_376731 [Podospora appendiculata]|uniref:NADH:ubiquinone oxidoreductase 20.1kD subunit n=1 Tax=Podospora appendiculata TaxID=314037 RepID=A0AAE0XC87_9PEZI|nr:hypothetical protein B0T22DRAFT_376731 [Podospora appendiculata]
MLSRRIVAKASPLRLAAAQRLPIVQHRTFLPDSHTGRKLVDEKYPDSDYPTLTEAEDPDMVWLRAPRPWADGLTMADNVAQNGGYVNPPRIKRQFRDPHADWWDKQERRNYGEPVHEDHDLLGMFTPYEYTWVSPAKGAMQIGVFVAVFLSVCYGVSLVYPDKPSYPREFEGGLLRELGGPGAVRARQAGDPDP